MVRKVGKDIWTNLGGHPEPGETEEEALLREIEEELNCEGKIIKKLGDFEAPAAHDDAIVRLSVYLTELSGEPVISDPELEEFKFLTKDRKEEGIRLPISISEKVLPFCIENKLLDW